MPQFKAYTTDSTIITDSLLKGKVVVINFWFAECAPCVVEIPYLNKLVDSLKNEDVIFIAISKDDKQSWNPKTANIFHFVHITGGKYLCDRFHIHGYPTTIIFGKDGKVKSYEVGFGVDFFNKNLNKFDSKVKETLKIIRSD